MVGRLEKRFAEEGMEVLIFSSNIKKLAGELIMGPDGWRDVFLARASCFGKEVPKVSKILMEVLPENYRIQITKLEWRR